MGAKASTSTSTSKKSGKIPANAQEATFAAGCFWGVEKFFNKQFGSAIYKTRVGYTGGNSDNPSYESVCSGSTGHAESLRIIFDPTKVGYADLVTFFWRMHDPTTLNRQGNDTGTQYRSTIFYHSEEQKQIANEVLEVVKPKFSKPIITEIRPVSTFFDAETYHQEYLKKHPDGYCNHKIQW